VGGATSFSETGAAAAFSCSRSVSGMAEGSLVAVSSSTGCAEEGAAQGISAALRDAQKLCCFFFFDLGCFGDEGRAEPAAGCAEPTFPLGRDDVEFPFADEDFASVTAGAGIAPGVAEAGFVRDEGAWAAEGDEDDD